MLSTPTGSTLVTHVALLETSGCEEHALIGLPLAWKLTVPVGGTGGVMKNHQE